MFKGYNKDQLIAAMTDFATTTPNDKASVLVARVATRLQHLGHPFERPLSRTEIAVARSFLPEDVRKATAQQAA